MTLPENIQEKVNEIKQSIQNKLDEKVTIEEGKGLSSNDYTTTEKNKLAGIANNATKTIVDSDWITNSENPIQSKLIKTELDKKAKQSDYTNLSEKLDATIEALGTFDDNGGSISINLSNLVTQEELNGKVDIVQNQESSFLITDSSRNVTTKNKIGEIDFDGKIGTDEGKIITTGTGGKLQASTSITKSKISDFSHTHNYLPTNGDGTTNGTITASKFIKNSNSTNLLLANGNDLAQSTFLKDANETVTSANIASTGIDFSKLNIVKTDITGLGIPDNNHTHSNYEENSNKVTSTNGWSSTTSDTKYPSEKLVKDSLDEKLAISQTSYKGQNVVVDSTSGEITFELKPSIPSASSTLPGADVSGGAIGNETTWAKADHQHPLSSAYAPASHNQASSTITDTNTYSNIGNTTNYLDNILLNINSKIGTINGKISSLENIELVEVTSDKGTASADTMNKLYLVAESTSATNDNYEVFITVRTGTSGNYTYAWEKVDTARIDLSSKLNISQTSYKGKNVVVDATTGNITFENKNNHSHGQISNDGKITTTTNTVGNVVVTDGSDIVKVKNKIPYANLDGVASSTHTHDVSDIEDLDASTISLSYLSEELWQGLNQPQNVQDGCDRIVNKLFNHGHGQITNDGKIGSNADYFVTTTTGGAITSQEKIGNISTAGKIGTNANKPIITGTNGLIQTGDFGSAANTFCQGNDSRLSDSRLPKVTVISAPTTDNNGDSVAVDLDIYGSSSTYPVGFYYCGSNAAAKFVYHTPRVTDIITDMENGSGNVNDAFFLLVEVFGTQYSSSYIKQTLTYYLDSKTYVRTKKGSGDHSRWTSWFELTHPTIDSTNGGTNNSSNLITSGAVYNGLNNIIGDSLEYIVNNYDSGNWE